MGLCIGEDAITTTFVKLRIEFTFTATIFETKHISLLGAYFLPVEVRPHARAHDDIIVFSWRKNNDVIMRSCRMCIIMSDYDIPTAPSTVLSLHILEEL